MEPNCSFNLVLRDLELYLLVQNEKEKKLMNYGPLQERQAVLCRASRAER